jgi:hypothetical protein
MVTAFDAEERALAAGYGVISPETWLTKRRELDARKRNGLTADKHSFREDYEIGVRNGEFHVNYLGQCTTCGFSYKFEHKETLKT